MRDFESIIKTVGNGEGSRCNYPTRLDTYGCGCSHDCSYCYAKSLLDFRGLWNPQNPSVGDMEKISRQIKRLPHEVVRLGNIVGFCAVLHQPHGIIRNLKRCSRIVILPDYQGVGLGTKFLETIAKYYSEKGFQFSIVTSAKNMISALNRSEHWKMKRYSVSNCGNKKSRIDYHRKSIRTNCKTASFFYKS